MVVSHVNVCPHTSCRTNAPPVPHAFVSRFAGTMRLANGTEISSCVALVPGATSRLQIQIQASHHRADHAGAVLSVVNALRFASTRPAAGPSGIDDACARHDLGYCAMAGFLMTRAGREKRVDAGFPRAYLDVSRLCPTAHPPHRTSACRARFQSSPSGHDSSAPPTTSRQAATPSRCA